MITSVRRRLTKGVDFTASYTLAKATSTIGSSVDQLNSNNIVDPNDPFGGVQNGPTSDTDARHRVGLSATFELPGGLRVSPIYYFRTALPVALIDGRDLNRDGEARDLQPRAFAVDSFDAATGVTTFKDIGSCDTVNCGRGLSQQQVNIRVAKVFHLRGRAQVDVVGEAFNLFNEVNPSDFRARVTVPSTGAADPLLLQPQTYSGDFRRPEQRVGQIGFRFSF